MGPSDNSQLVKAFTGRPYGLAWRSNTLFIVATVGIALFTDLFLYGLVVPILPALLRDKIGLPQDEIQTHVSGLLAVFAASSVVTSPIAGIIADRVKTRQAPFFVGLASLLVATFLLSVGRTLPVLYVARVLQGISGGFVWTVGMALCLETVGPENLGKTIGSIFSFISVGSLAAPAVGGTLYEKAGNAGVFGTAFALLAVDLIMRAIVIEKKVARKYGLEESNSASDSDTRHSDVERQSDNADDPNADEEQPLLTNKPQPTNNAYKLSPDQPRLFHLVPILPCLANASLLTALAVALVQAIMLGSFDATIPTVAHSYFGYDSLQSGLLFLPLGASDLLLGPLFGWAVDHYGTKPVATGSYAYLAAPLLLLRLPHAGGQQQKLLFAGLLALCGIGLAGIGAPSMVEAGAVVEKYYEANPEFFGANGPYAQLYGLQSMVFSAGLAVGPELAGSLKGWVGYGDMNAVLAGLCVGTAGLCFVFLGGKRGRRDG